MGFGSVVIPSTYSVFASGLDSKDVVVQNMKELILPKVSQILIQKCLKGISPLLNNSALYSKCWYWSHLNRNCFKSLVQTL